MKTWSCLPAAVLAAAAVLFAPAAGRANRPPANPLEPTGVIFSDPWRPDMELPTGAYQSSRHTTLEQDPASQGPAAVRRESWLDVVLRILRHFILGGAR
jgi:hypothetical protein